MPSRVDAARTALGVVRIVNGVAALGVPKILMRRLGLDPAGNRAAVYGLRMFGIRTILIGLDLLSPDPQVRSRAVSMAPLIHGSDTISAVVAGIGGDIPVRTTVLAAAISGGNAALAMLAQSGREQRH